MGRNLLSYAVFTARVGTMWSQKQQTCVNEMWKLRLGDLQKASHVVFRSVEIIGNHLRSKCSSTLPQLFLASSPPLAVGVLVLSLFIAQLAQRDTGPEPSPSAVPMAVCTLLCGDGSLPSVALLGST